MDGGLSCRPKLIASGKNIFEETEYACHTLRATQDEDILEQRFCQDSSCSEPAHADDDFELFAIDCRDQESKVTPRVSNKSLLTRTTYATPNVSQPLGFNIYLMKDTVPVQGCQKRGRFLVWPVGIGESGSNLCLQT